MYANPSCPAGCPCDLLRLLHGPHRVACRLVMVLLSHHGLPAVTIAGLLGCDPSTVRRWIHRYDACGASGLADRPRAGRPRLGSPCLHQRLLRLLAQPKARPAGCGARWAGLHQQLNDLPEDAVVLAEDETHVNLLPWVRASWIAGGSGSRS